ncbi:MAG: sporulation protein YabP [Ruminococcaceae bacterium]|nr:sporulation protein YabP [Oscillospiraceae bacterium]
MDEKKEMQHKITMENRENLCICGVEDVESFDESDIVIYTVNGILSVKGCNLHINRLNTESGELMIDGEIDSLVYSNTEINRGGFFTKLFK